MTRTIQRLLSSLGLLLVALFALSNAAQAAGTGWSITSSPNPSPNSNSLQAVAAISTNKVWAVGYSVQGTSKSNMVKRTLIERFNGTGWQVVKSPNVGTGDNALNGIAAISANNVWAAGYSSNGALTLHFDGHGWHVVAAAPACQLNAITAISASDLWAVGTASGKTCAEHFDGTSWSIVQTPNMGTSDNTLQGVSASSSHDVWAVGSYCVGSICDRGGGSFQTLIIHYDGSRWSVASSPNPSTSVNQLNAVAVVSPTNAWAVGGYSTAFATDSTLVLHFDGTSWTQVASPGVKGSSILMGIAVNSATDIYAVGSASIPTAPAFPTLIEHFDGNTWSTVSSPSPGVHNGLNAVAHVPGATIGNAQFWAVGAYDNNSPSLTLTERDI